jgi:HK97 family phage portal protein
VTALTLAVQRIRWVLRSYWTAAYSLRDPALAALLGGAPTTSGVTVTEQTALNISAVWAAVSCIAGDVASLPLFHYQRTEGGGKRRYVESRLYRVLHDEFNPEMSAMVGRETLTQHALLWGNGYAEIQRNDLGQVVALWPITPDRVQPYRDMPMRALRYRVTNPSGTPSILAAESMFHLPGLGFDGVIGYAVVAKARESFGMALAAERLGGSFFGNGVKHSGFFEHPKTLGETAKKHITESIAMDRPGGYRILEEGMTFKPVTMPMKDAQFLESRKFQINEIARWFGIPPHKLADLERATFSNIEEQNIDYVVGTLRRWLVRIEQECNRKLIPPLERRQQFCEHLVDGLLRGNIQSRYAAYAVGRNWGWLSADDVRELENMNPLPDGQGQVYLIPTNMAPADRTDEIIDAQVRPDPAPNPAGPAQDDRVEKIVEDLRAEIGRRHEAVTAGLEAVQQSEEAHHAALAKGLVALPRPASLEDLTASTTAFREEFAVLQARLASMLGEVTTTLEGLDVRAPVPPPPVPGVDEATLETHLTPVRAAIDTAQQATVETITARLATDEALRGWREATFALIAGKLVRRELAQAKKREADPTEAVSRAEAFYRRFVPDSMAELRPWLLRLPEAAARESAVQACLVRWAEEAVGAYGAALTNGGLGALIRQWEMKREAVLTRALMEAIDGHWG